MSKKNAQAGISIIELLLVIALTSILLPALLTGLVASRQGKVQQTQRIEAVTYLKELSDSVRSARDTGWTTFAVNGTYHPVISGSLWTLASGAETVNGFTRQVVISDVYRDSSGNIVTSGGTLDPSTRKLVLTVSWTQPYASSIQSTLYLTRFQDNLSHIETLITDFNASGSIQSGVTVRQTTGASVGDGEVVLGAGGYGNWCNPNLTTASSDLSGNGVAQGVWAIEGRAFVGTGDNAAGLDFINVALNNPPQPTPPSITEQGTYDQNLKTNDVFGDLSGGTNYAYISTNNNTKEVAILNASNNPPTLVSSIDVPGSPSGNSVFVLNDILYVTQGTKLYTYNVSNRASPQSLTNVTLNSTGKNIFVVGDYVYIAESSNGREMEIVQVSNNGATLSVVGYADTAAASGQDVYVNQTGTRAYFIAPSSSAAEFFIIDTSTKTGSRPTISSRDTNGMDPKALTVTSGNRVIIVGHGGIEYQVFNIDNESSPSECGSEDAPESLNGVSSVLEADGDAYSYIITQNSSAEFRIIVGGPGGSYANSGTFESATFNPGYQTANNRFAATYAQPASTSIQYQVSMAGLSGSPAACPTPGGYTFVGPDGTSNTYFTPASGAWTTYPFGTYQNYANPGQCLRYKVFLSTTDSNSTPVFNEIEINYSP